MFNGASHLVTVQPGDLGDPRCELLGFLPAGLASPAVDIIDRHTGAFKGRLPAAQGWHWCAWSIPPFRNTQNWQTCRQHLGPRQSIGEIFIVQRDQLMAACIWRGMWVLKTSARLRTSRRSAV